MPKQWKQFSGAWTPTQQLQARGANTWPAVPGAPTIGTATAGNAEATVPFTAPADTGYPTTLTYEVTSSPGSITATGSSSPITVTGLTNGVSYTFTVTATNDTGTGPASAASNSVTPVQEGGLWAAGKNNTGTLGTNNTTTYSSPIQIGALTDWSELGGSMGTNSSYGTNFALKSDGTIWAWGYNTHGALGINLNNASGSYVASSPTQIGALTTWTKIAARTNGGYAIKNDGTLWAWGRNQYGDVGDNSIIPRSSPVQIGAGTDWAYVGRGGRDCSFAIKTDGTMWSWGKDAGGILGQNTFYVYKSSPTQIGALTTWASVNSLIDSAVAIKTDGTIWAWGVGVFGSLGNNNGIARSSPVQIGALTNWLEASAGYQMGAIKTDGTLWTWGYNNVGQLGRSNTINTSSPTQLGSGTWSKISTGDRTMGGITTGGELYMWGFNGDGQAMFNNIQNSSSPIQVGTETTWVDVTKGGVPAQTFAIKGT
jgi:alpha-tubulin suppressor-like RCC1 family protein